MKLLFISISLLLLQTINAFPCDYCNKEIKLTKDLANCFNKRFEEEINKLRSSDLPVTLIDLASCTGASRTTRGGQGIPMRIRVNTRPDTAFLLDKKGLLCLRSFLKRENINWTPIAVFRTNVDC